MAQDARIAHAGVPYPPPILYVAGVLIGRLLDRWRPLPITHGASTVREAIAVAAIVIYLGIFLSAFRLFRRARTTIIPSRPAAALVMDGPYRRSRNPMYVSLVALYSGITLLLNTWWPFVLLPFVVLAIDRLVIAREERYLASAFPAEYGEYSRQVRRWL